MPELVFLLACVLMVASVIVPTFFIGKEKRKHLAAKADVESILDACREFYREYGVWPTAYAGDQGDILYGRLLPNYEVMNALRGVSGQGNEQDAVNPKRLNFLHISGISAGVSGLNERGDFMDPWGSAYQIVLDANLNNIADVRDTIYSQVIGEGCLVWSSGPDRISDTKDDILSWKWNPGFNIEPGTEVAPGW